jgi:hypothetical protein
LALSTDRGETWERFKPNAPIPTTFGGIASLALYRGVLYIGESDEVYRSTDLGRTVDTVSTGLGRGPDGNGTITDISITSTYMVAGSIGQWVWIRPLSQVLPPASTDGAVSPYALRLEQNRPNPTGSTSYIPYTLTSPGYVSLKLYNGSSQEIATLVNERKEAGEHIANVDVFALPGGIYYYRLSVDGSSLTRRMLVVK